MKSHLQIGIASAAVALIALGFFQNCSHVDFQTADQSVGTAGNPLNPLASATPSAPTPAPICDPFSGSSSCSAGVGLRGNLYYLASGDTTSPRDKVGDIMTYGLKSATQIVMSQLDVPSRAWDTGFPGPSGVLQNTDGSPLVEWFALDLTGTFRLSSTFSDGDYQFALYSDDGSILDLDGVTVLDFDGQHAPAWKCAPLPVALKAGDLRQIRVRYFQGPRNQIALRLMWRPWSNHASSCDDNGGFTVVPSSVLFN